MHDERDGESSPRGPRRRVSARLQLSHVVKVFEEHLHKDMTNAVQVYEARFIAAALRPPSIFVQLLLLSSPNHAFVLLNRFLGLLP